MPTRCLLVALLALAACSRAGEDPVPGDAARLAGRWELVAHRSGYDDLHALVTLAPSDTADPEVPQVLKGGTLEGSFQLQNGAWLPAPPSDSSASAFLAADSAVVLYLRLTGRCTNCGNLGFAGRLAGDSVTGHWTQEMPGGTPPNGSFSLQRARAETPAAD